MEAAGRDCARGSCWSYRHEENAGSSSYTISSSSRSGTIVSTTYTSGASRLSSGFSMEATLDLDLELELRLGTPETKDTEFGQAIKKHRKETKEALKEMRMRHIESLVQEFVRGASENHSTLGRGDDMSALERWFSELGVSWVLQLDVGASTLVPRHPPPCEGETWSWIRGLTQIMETIHLTDHGHGFVGMPGISEEGEVDSGKQASNPLQFALFFQKAMAKMLIFVDVMFSNSICIHERLENSGLQSLSKPGPKATSSVSLRSCLKVNRALSEVLSDIRLLFHSLHTEEVEKIEKEMVSLLSAKQGKAFDAIWSFMEERRTRSLKSMEDSLGAETPQGSSDIHQATCSVMNHINFLLHNCWAVDPLFLSQAASLGKYVHHTGLEEEQPFINMVIEMVSCLEEKLLTKSQSFLDKGLSLLFLLNNSNFIQEEFQYSIYRSELDLEAVISSINLKVERYTESYIQVAWEPMLACLSNPTPLCLVRKYSPLSKFESKFLNIYTTQELWKVPDPRLRKRLRKAVIRKIIPGYTKFIEDNKVTDAKFTPHELEDMLQELFEGDE